jgi:hypothetical protein
MRCLRVRGTRLVLALSAAVAIGAIVTAVQAAIPDSTGQIHACYSANGAKATNGTSLYIVDSASASCAKGQTQVTWNQTGVKGDKGDPGVNGTNGTDGTDGVSVTSSSLAVGDANCPTGGSSFTSVSGTTFACNGAKGDKGDPGTNGTSVTSTSLSVGDSNCPDGGSSFTSASGTTYACNGANGSGGSATAGPTQYLARGVLDCPGGAATCLAPELSPSGNTNPENGGNLDFVFLPVPPGGMTAAHLTINLVGTTPPSGQNMVFNLVQGGSSNVFLSCTITGPASSCDTGATTASIPGNTDIVIEIDTSFQFSGSPNHFADITWQGTPN